MGRGQLRVYLGAAPGVGKTFDMLSEGHRRVERGTDVVVGFVETHGRPHTAELLEGLEVIPRREVTYRGATFTEMDLDAVLARRPQVALVDELAHTNVPGSRHAKRWQDVDELLAAGIDVISTVNIQHLESLNDVVASITGVTQRETIPDHVVRRADQIELVDMTPEALRRRLAHGNVYAAEKVDAALANYFRIGNLTALRELALLWMADRVDDALEKYRADEGIDAIWPARERIVVALTGGPEGETLLRRGARIAGRGAGGELLAVHVSRADGLSSTPPGALDRQRALTESLGGTFHTVVGEDVAGAILDFARGVNAAMIVVGVSRRPRWMLSFQEGVGDRVVRQSGAIDVHVVTHERAGQGTLLRRADALSRNRRTAGWLLAVLGSIALTALLVSFRDMHELPSDLLLFLALTVGVALVGGLWPAVTAAVFGSLLLNWYLTPPYNTLTIGDPANALALAIFILVAVGVASVVDLAARRTLQAARSSSEADTLSALAGSVLRGENTVTAILEQLRERFAMDAVTLLERDGDGAEWRVVTCAGGPPCRRPDEGTAEVTVSDTVALSLRGPALEAGDRRVLEAFAHQAAVVLDRQRLRQRAEEARRLEAGEAIRTSLLAAVSHDLRTPLAAIKAGVTSLRQDDIDWSDDDETALLATIGDATDALERLIDNLLDLSRLETRTIRPTLRPVSLDEVVPRATTGVPPGSVALDIPESLPLLVTDAGLLERAIANVVENAVKYSPPGAEVTVSAALVPGTSGEVELRVVDRGPGVREADKATMFQPFQRLGDSRAPRDGSTAGSGVGLGLAVARGFVDALGGTIAADDTPGGGLTMVVRLPIAPVPVTTPDRVEETA
ncbi:sensor histidine kinase [Jiangella rhizosphaerae]|uniref:histidine kinase n=1 Tax=Jiangella rhizosphaerae TaxID=2293569 RepID=A0A418KWF7_9ACTN|nr:sensor histidine kinase KdpD [Jiangella rhizosphaerae]RIQ34038.1 sensor histidine kinase KdpD [Jiangella rhizosphaerae]